MSSTADNDPASETSAEAGLQTPTFEAQQRADWFGATFDLIVSNITSDGLFDDRSVRLIVACLIAEGHAVVVDSWNVGVDAMTLRLSSTIKGSLSSRVVLSSESVASDILGVTVYDSSKAQFAFHKGPIFSSLTLLERLDLANISALHPVFEALGRGVVTVDGAEYRLGSPFMALATLPAGETRHETAAILDHFLIRVKLGEPHKSFMRRVLHKAPTRRTGSDTQPIIAVNVIPQLAELCRSADVSDDLLERVWSVMVRSKESAGLVSGLSVTAMLGWLDLGRVWAMANCRPAVTPQDLIDLAEPVLAHRLLPIRGHRIDTEGVLAHLMGPMAGIGANDRDPVVVAAPSGRDRRAALVREILDWLASNPGEGLEGGFEGNSAASMDKISGAEFASTLDWMWRTGLIDGIRNVPGGLITHPRITLEGREALDDPSTPFEFVRRGTTYFPREGALTVTVGEHSTVHGIQVGGRDNVLHAGPPDATDSGTAPEGWEAGDDGNRRFKSPKNIDEAVKDGMREQGNRLSICDHATIGGVQSGGSGNTQWVNQVLSESARSEILDVLDRLLEDLAVTKATAPGLPSALTELRAEASSTSSHPEALQKKAASALVLATATAGGQAVVNGLSRVIELLGS